MNKEEITAEIDRLWIMSDDDLLLVIAGELAKPDHDPAAVDAAVNDLIEVLKNELTPPNE